MEKDISKVAVRDALPPRREPYWIRLTTGHSLGFRRMTESSVGTWIARFWEPVQSKKPMKTLGDFSDIPKGERFNAARKAAEEWFTHLGRGGKTGKFTVTDICAEYVEHVRDTKGEMKKIVWPSRKQVRNNFIVVAIFVTLAALLIFGLDTLFFTIMKFVVNLGSSAA